MHRSLLLLVLCSVIILLAVLGTVTKIAFLESDSDSHRGLHDIATLFDLDGENTLPAWYSSMLLFTCSLLLGLVTWTASNNADRYFWHWAILAATLGSVSFWARFHFL